MTVSRVSLAALLDNDGTTVRTLADHLASLTPSQRIDDLRAVPGSKMAKLFALCAESDPLVLDDIVPPAATGPIIHEGKNSLPMFTQFQKRFCRRDGAMIGYNHQAMSFVTGPGYFTVVEVAEKPKELLLDYTKIPATAPEGWPTIKDNAKGISYLVYRGMHDYCRKVGPSLLIGRAHRDGKESDNYFMLGRVDS